MMVIIGSLHGICNHNHWASHRDVTKKYLWRLWLGLKLKEDAISSKRCRNKDSRVGGSVVLGHYRQFGFGSFKLGAERNINCVVRKTEVLGLIKTHPKLGLWNGKGEVLE